MMDNDSIVPRRPEAERLAALRDYDILDTPRERAFDDMAKLAGAVCEAPVALVSFVAEDRQWFKAADGLDIRETPLNASICRHAIRHGDLFVVPDTTLDARTASNPLVSQPPNFRFYAGAVIRTGDGLPLGTLCVLDYRPRPDGLTPLQTQTLRTLSQQVMSQLELRRLVMRHEEADRRLQESEERLEQALDASRVVGTWVWEIEEDRIYTDARFARLYSIDPELARAGAHPDLYLALVHDADQEHLRSEIVKALRDGFELRVDYRVLKPDGSARWMTSVGRVSRNAAGRAIKLTGVVVDISDRKSAEEALVLVSRELNHRIKNLFALTSGLISLSARGHPEAAPFADLLRGRLASLSRAHDYVRPSAERPAESFQTLHGLVQTLLEPYEQSQAQRFAIDGDDIPVGAGAATAMALIVHELATNSLKYGALSAELGQVQVDGRSRDKDYTLTWRERGGPGMLGTPDRQGFGSQMADRAVSGQLGGRIEREWHPDGLLVRVTAPTDRFAN